MPKLQVIPTCLFRGIDFLQLIENYNNGKYAHVDIPNDVVKVDTNVYDLYGDSPYDQIYSVTDGNQLQRVIGTTNHEDFDEKYNELKKSVSENKSFYDKQLDADTIYNKISRCRFTGQDFSHKPIGIPFRVEDTVIRDNDGNYKNITVFHCRGKFKDFRCALGYIEMKISAKYDQRDSRYVRAKFDLQMMYTLMHPTGPFLEAAVDPDVLDIHDGCATVKEYNDDKYQYVNTGNLIILPCKEEFSRSMTIKIK